jgi:hypothetical protein
MPAMRTTRYSGLKPVRLLGVWSCALPELHREVGDKTQSAPSDQWVVLPPLIGDSVDEIARRSQGAANATSWRPGRLIRKIDNFLPSGLMIDIVFQKVRQLRLALTWANARPRAWASRTGNDSGMAPQTIEIA